MTPARRNLYNLAENLGMLVSDIEARMSVNELVGWIMYYQKQDKIDTEDAGSILRGFGLAD